MTSKSEIAYIKGQREKELLRTPRGSVWRHYKGGCYKVLGVGVDSETKQLRVSYRRCHVSGKNANDPTEWHRPVESWHSDNEDGKPRFTRIK